MSQELVADELWEVIEPLLLKIQKNPIAAGPASTTEQPSAASCSSSGAAYPERCCPKRWAVDRHDLVATP
jgi:hypothetical protein